MTEKVSLTQGNCAIYKIFIKYFVFVYLNVFPYLSSSYCI